MSQRRRGVLRVLCDLCVNDFAGKRLNTENAEKTGDTEKKQMRKRKLKWKFTSQIKIHESRITILAAYPTVAPISFSLAAARLASSVPGYRRTTARSSRTAEAFWPSSARHKPFLIRAEAVLKLLG